MQPADHAAWIGRSAEAVDRVEAAPLRRLAATLEDAMAPVPAGTMPLLGHWLFHLPDATRSSLGTDGHPLHGGFLPPVAQPRRMWAGGRLRFVHPVAIGASIVKRTSIAAISEKHGTAGTMTFVTLRHVIAADGIAAIEEEQDLVFLPITSPAVPRPVDVPDALAVQRMTVDEAMLFRFSALTFNAHRIHYDLAYARDVELYPALVVHGPLQAMLLLNHALLAGATPGRFAFRARSPLYAGEAFTLASAGDRLWVRNARDDITMTAEIA